MGTPTILPCGCCTNGCICDVHRDKSLYGPGWILSPIVCDYHLIQNQFEEDMRLAFGKRMKDDGL